MFYGRPLSLERLFSNLVDNAIHYGRSVEIEGWIDDEAEQLVVGLRPWSGFVDVQKTKVFSLLSESIVDPARFMPDSGLVSVQNITQLHGGTIEMKDRPAAPDC